MIAPANIVLFVIKHAVALYLPNHMSAYCVITE